MASRCFHDAAPINGAPRCGGELPAGSAQNRLAAGCRMARGFTATSFPSVSPQAVQIHKESLTDDRPFGEPDSVGVESWHRFVAPPAPAAALAAMRSRDRKGLAP